MIRVAGHKVGVDYRGRDAFAPYLTVSVEVGGCVLRLEAIIDSGADATLIPIEVLKGCPVDWDALKLAGPAGGAGGAFETRFLTAEVKYREWLIAREVRIAGPGSKLKVMLLGRQDFFRHFTVNFRWDVAPPFVELEPVPVIAPVQNLAVRPKKK